MCQAHTVLSGTKCLFYLILFVDWMEKCAGRGFYNTIWSETIHWRLFTTFKNCFWRRACIYFKFLLKSRVFPSIANVCMCCTYLSFSFHLSSILHQIPHDFGLPGPSCHMQRCFSSLGNRSQSQLTAALKKSGIIYLHKAYDVGFIK